MDKIIELLTGPEVITGVKFLVFVVVLFVLLLLIDLFLHNKWITISVWLIYTIAMCFIWNIMNFGEIYELASLLIIVLIILCNIMCLLLVFNYTRNRNKK